MKKLYRIIVLSASLLISATAAFAGQNLRTGYFLDGYTYRYQLNPAFQGERGYFAIPVLGYTSLGLESNLALSTFLYPTGNGNLTTALNSSISDDTFLNALNKRNHLNVNLNTSLISFGFHTKKSWHTIDISLKSDMNLNLPKDLFRFMKVGAADGNTSYDISNIGARVESRLELAYGYSRTIADWIHVGARLKFLVGLVRADMSMDDMQLNLSGEEWSIRSQGHMNIAGPVHLGTKEGMLDWDSFEFDSANLVPRNFGGAVDLGVAFDFLEYFTASASVLDLGFISWNNNVVGTTPDYSWRFNGFGDITSEDNALDKQLEGIGNELLNAFDFVGEPEARKSIMLAATLHVGLEAKMPFYERLSFGLLGTRRFNGAYSWTEGRLSANVAPLNWLSLAADYAISDFGHSVGAALNIHAKGFTMFIGTDSFLPLCSVTPKYFIPVERLNTNLAFGLNISFGKYKGRFVKDKVEDKK